MSSKWGCLQVARTLSYQKGTRCRIDIDCLDIFLHYKVWTKLSDPFLCVGSPKTSFLFCSGFDQWSCISIALGGGRFSLSWRRGYLVAKSNELCPRRFLLLTTWDCVWTFLSLCFLRSRSLAFSSLSLSVSTRSFYYPKNLSKNGRNRSIGVSRISRKKGIMDKFL